MVLRVVFICQYHTDHVTGLSRLGGVGGTTLPPKQKNWALGYRQGRQRVREWLLSVQDPSSRPDYILKVSAGDSINVLLYKPRHCKSYIYYISSNQLVNIAWWNPQYSTSVLMKLASIQFIRNILICKVSFIM